MALTGVDPGGCYFGYNMDMISTALDRTLMLLGLPGNFNRIANWRKDHISEQKELEKVTR